MKKMILSASMTLTFAAFSAFGASMTGFIADSKCAAGGKGNSEAHADCAAKCIKGGAAPVLVVGEKVYKISNPDKVADFAGKKVSVAGKVEGDTVTIDKVE